MLLKAKVEKLEEKYVPVRRQSDKKNKPIWMTHKAFKAVRHRRQLYRKYRDTKHPAYVKAAKKASALVKQAKRNFEEKLAIKIKEDKKSFFAYVRRKCKSNAKVGSLLNNQGQQITTAREKAEVLNDFFLFGIYQGRHN